ncbi:alpha/beta hydrolase-fold protein [Amycolatopsis sp. GM8]|uniref:alpha/beta hydrolase-fold protein n=1 Tax=Amycolatopsis sp. GM8 TaxID=2896530 RepID=UPI001EEDDBF2|nr:alpha/beta hydrolase-fold protein [Amycolatopsis sp. GM8]
MRFRVSRRSMLVAGASGLGVAAFAVLPAEPTVQRAVVSSSRVERVWSAARSREVDLVTMLPPAPAPGLPMVLVLHGLHGRAQAAAPTGTLAELTAQIARGAVAPFGFVAVDGGDNYWHENHPGDDPMAMLLEEVPVWLRQRGLSGADGLPFGVLGMSMGGFGGLLYARRRGERRQRMRALALLAPALILSWQEMAKRDAFHNATDWASMDPLKHLSATAGVATGVWCGTEDPFIQGTRRFIAATHPQVAYTARGKHGDSFNRTVVPSVIGFLGRQLG